MLRVPLKSKLACTGEHANTSVILQEDYDQNKHTIYCSSENSSRAEIRTADNNKTPSSQCSAAALTRRWPLQMDSGEISWVH